MSLKEIITFCLSNKEYFNIVLENKLYLYSNQGYKAQNIKLEQLNFDEY